MTTSKSLMIHGFAVYVDLELESAELLGDRLRDGIGLLRRLCPTVELVSVDMCDVNRILELRIGENFLDGVSDRRKHMAIHVCLKELLIERLEIVHVVVEGFGAMLPPALRVNVVGPVVTVGEPGKVGLIPPLKALLVRKVRPAAALAFGLDLGMRSPVQHGRDWRRFNSRRCLLRGRCNGRLRGNGGLCGAKVIPRDQPLAAAIHLDGHLLLVGAIDRPR